VDVTLKWQCSFGFGERPLVDSADSASLQTGHGRYERAVRRKRHQNRSFSGSRDKVRAYQTHPDAVERKKLEMRLRKRSFADPGDEGIVPCHCRLKWPSFSWKASKAQGR